MALTYSTDKTDETGRELLSYGTPDFPIAFFDDDLAKISISWHWHNELELVLMLSGEARVYIGRHEIRMKAGEGYFANSGILHSAELKTKTGRQHAMIFDPHIVASEDDIIWNRYVSPLLADENLPFLKLTPEIPWQKNVLSRMEKVWNAGAFEEDDYPLTVRSSLSLIIRDLVRNSEEDGSEHPFASKVQRDELRVKKTLRYIETHYRDQVTLNDIAQSANISVSSLLRLYHDILHTTPVRHLVRHRLERAAAQLRMNTEVSVSETAYSCGFNDISYFNRCFLKMYGKTPTTYRQNP